MSTIPATFDKETPRFEGNPQDFYVTDPRLVKACLTRLHELKPHAVTLLDPGCGSGNWGRGMQEVWTDITWRMGVDLVNRMEGLDNPYNHVKEMNFLDPELTKHDLVKRFDIVAGNPPFSAAKDKTLARKFIVRGLELLNPLGYMGYILKTEALCSQDRYDHIFMNNPPIEQWVCVQRPGWYGDGTTNTIEYSWFIWAKQNPAGYTKTRWLNWR